MPKSHPLDLAQHTFYASLPPYVHQRALPAQPTCGDTDLTREGAQEFSGCELPDVFNASAVNVKSPSKEACCARVR